MNEMTKLVDVLIGVLNGYCLERYGISTLIAEQHHRNKQTIHGRAAMITPRSLEMLDQLDLVDCLGHRFVVREQHWHENGKRIVMI